MRGGGGDVTSVTCDIFWGFLMDNERLADRQTDRQTGREAGRRMDIRRRKAIDLIDIEMKCEIPLDRSEIHGTARRGRRD